MAEFEIEAKVVPKIDERQKRKVQKELGSSFSMGGGATGRAGKRRADEIESHLSLSNVLQRGTNQKLDEIKTILLSQGGGAISAGVGGVRGGFDKLGGILKKPLTEAFLDAQTSGTLKDAMNERMETDKKGVEKLEEIVEELETLTNLQRLSLAIRQRGKQKLPNIGGGGALAGLLGGSGALVGGAGLLGGLLSFATGGNKVVEGRARRASGNLQEAFSGEDVGTNLAKAFVESFKTFVDPFGVKEALGDPKFEIIDENTIDILDGIIQAGKGGELFEELIGFEIPKIPNLSSLTSFDWPDFPDLSTLKVPKFPTLSSFNTSVSDLGELTLPSIGFSVPDKLNGLLNYLSGNNKGITKEQVNSRAGRGIGLRRSDIGTGGGVNNPFSFNFDIPEIDIAQEFVPEVDINASDIADELETTIKDEIEKQIDQFERQFSVDL